MKKFALKHPLLFWGAGIAVGVVAEVALHNLLGGAIFFIAFWAPGIYVMAAQEKLI